jgi:ribonuclease HII
MLPQCEDAIAFFDEVGAGCLFGPLAVGCVITHPNIPHGIPDWITDSKKMSPIARRKGARAMRKAETWHGVASATVTEIDALGISKALFLAMERAMAKAKARYAQGCKISLAVVDGSRDFGGSIGGVRLYAEPKADATMKGVSAASVFAKVYRDKLVEWLAKGYKGYNIEKNKGYPVPDHVNALVRLGPTPLHRKVFVVTAMKRMVASGVSVPWLDAYIGTNCRGGLK